ARKLQLAVKLQLLKQVVEGRSILKGGKCRVIGGRCALTPAAQRIVVGAGRQGDGTAAAGAVIDGEVPQTAAAQVPPVDPRALTEHAGVVEQACSYNF